MMTEQGGVAPLLFYLMAIIIKFLLFDLSRVIPLVDACVKTAEIAMPSSCCKTGYTYCADSNTCYGAFAQIGVVQPDALAACIADGGTLATFHSAGAEKCATDEIASQITSTTAFCPTNQQCLVWFGLIRAVPGSLGTASSDFIYVDGTQLDYTDWAPGEPNPTVFAPNENCAAFNYFTTFGGKWEDITCTTGGLGFVCEQPLQICPSFTTIGRCTKPGYTYCAASNKCFKVFSNQVNQPAALATCRADGGDLASVHSAGENDCIRNLITSTLGVIDSTTFPTFCPTGTCVSLSECFVWFGLTRRVSGSSGSANSDFIYTDGTPLDFRSFAPGEPTGNLLTCGLVEDCGSFGYYPGANAGWDDDPCSIRAVGFVCQHAVA